MDLNFNLFGKAVPKLTPSEQAKEWKKKLAQEGRKLDREIEKISATEKKALTECKKLAKEGRQDNAKILAKQVLNTRRAKERMQLSRATLNSVSMNLQTNISLLKVNQCFAKSAEVMHGINDLMKLPEMRETMKDMAREMARSGLIEDSLNDTFAGMEDPTLDSAADTEVDRILLEITGATLANASAAPEGLRRPAGAAAVQTADEAAATEDDSAEREELARRLEGL